MANSTYINDAIEQALLNVHTGFIAKVVNVSGDIATIQPLAMNKAVGGESSVPAIITACPVISSCGKYESFICQATGNECVKFKKVQTGDIVFCVCADRDISETRHGGMATPRPGHHEISFAVVIGVL
nr:MAG TPA: baseplate protein [Caudoviricetes sp.]